MSVSETFMPQMNKNFSTKIQAICFDLDGTLMDTSGDFVVVINQLLKKYHHPALTTAQVKKLIFYGSEYLIGYALGIDTNSMQFNKIHQEFLIGYDQQVHDRFRHHKPKFYPGMENLLNAIQSRNIKWGVVTNKLARFAIPILKQAGVLSQCQVVVCPDDVKKIKPDPEALLMACRKLNCDAHKTIFIGDHQRDIQAGNSAGMFTIGVSYGFLKDNENLKLWQADYLVDSVYEIRQWLDDNFWSID